MPFRGLKLTVGCAAGFVAAWCQVLLVAMLPLAALASEIDPVRNAPICHAETGTDPAPHKPDHSPHDCAQCVLCVSHAASIAILPPPPSVSAQRPAILVRLDAAQPRAPPLRPHATAQPRGPPVPI